MRTRTRHIVDTIVPGHGNIGLLWTTTLCNGTVSSGSTASGVVAPIEAKYTDEYMIDALGKEKIHSVMHRKRKVNLELTMPPYTGAQTNGTYVYSNCQYGDGWGYYRHANEILQTWALSNPGAFPFRWAMDWTHVNESILKENCFEKARQLKADVLLNIVEANQAWPTIQSLLKVISPKARDNWKTLRKFVKTASGGYLAWKFGVSPILSDVMAINRFLPKMGDAFKKHINQLPQHFSSVGTGIATFDDSKSTVQSQNGYVTHEFNHRGTVHIAPEIRYVLVVQPNKPPLTDFFRNLDYAMNRFATSPASLAWEKVPFSFVVDWFVDLRGLCRSIDEMLGFKPYKIVSFTRSSRYHVETSSRNIRRSPCNGNVLHDGAMGTVEFVHYDRSAASTTASAIEWKPRFGKNQAGITAALIGQALSKLK